MHFAKKLIVTLLLTLCTSPALADTAYAPLALDEKAPMANEANYLENGAGYEDETLSVKVETMRRYETNITLAYVQIADASQLRTAMAGRYGTKTTVTPQQLSQRVNAVLAINGDFFNFRPEGYLVRQGELLRERPAVTYDTLIIDEAGDFHIILDPTMEKIQLYTGTMVNTFNFGPALVIDGEPITTTKRMNIGKNKPTQRAAVCQMGPLSYLFVATEGPENKGSVGLTLNEFVELCHDLGAQQAYNLDGGSSSAMLLNGEKINALSTKKNRAICDILYVCTLVR